MGDNIEDQSGILEVPKLIKLAEENSLQNSTVTFVNGSNGKVTNEVVQVTSWAKLVEKEMMTGSSSSSPSKIKVSKPVPVNNKYNFSKNRSKRGMKKMVIHNSTSDNKGNIWLFWNASTTQPTVISMSSQMVTVSVGDVLVSGVHAHVKLVQRIFLWSEMEMISEMNKPWIILGEFNAILTPYEKVGGRNPNKSSMLEFSECLDKCELLQAPKTGLQYSWYHCQQGNKRILCTLDRVVFNQKWLQRYEEWGYKVGHRIVSDQSPLLGGCANIPKPKNKLKELKRIINDWNWRVFGNVNVKLKEAEIKVIKAMQVSDSNPFCSEAFDILVEAQNDHANREVQHNTLMRQKARVKWIKEGA
ncbi:uncharacterized protein LOC113352537 [Papaver somniferum]|uniref:uncharacterized protein LOC113352537 n=1 Tax=Papaver somniferum TaxID=3469 RepID=UPI000E6F94B7|nr:uncharacterized protein LOC113352537 [Papaver somniferum]